MKLYWNKTSFFGYAVLGLLFIRGFLNAVIPLMDKTEARYAEIARIMMITQNWITLQIDYGVPFWAKPPLSTWLSALSLKLFGINEFAVRFPYLLLAALMVFLIGKYAKREQLPFFLPGFILLTLPEFLLHAGVVSTDTSLAFSVALVMLSFWEALQNNSKWYWKYLIFVGFGLGLLAKGPIIFILTVPPLVVWSFLLKNYREIFKKIPWLIGSIITLTIALPWYILTEKATPGFIDYFIIGEHFKRFFDSSWSGDKYGFPKTQPLGIVWIFLFLFALPWIQIVIYKVWKQKNQILKNEWVIFLLTWLLWTPLFFTVSKSLIHPYIMPIMVPIALLATHWYKSLKYRKTLLKFVLIIPILAFLLVLIESFTKTYTKQYIPTDKYLVLENTDSNTKTYHLYSKSYSTQFYSKGTVENISVEDLEQKINDRNESFKVIIKDRDFKELTLDSQKKLHPIAKNYKKTIYRYSNK